MRWADSGVLSLFAFIQWLGRISYVKPPDHRPGLPGKVISFHIVPLDPAYKAGLAGHVPAKIYPIITGSQKKCI